MFQRFALAAIFTLSVSSVFAQDVEKGEKTSSNVSKPSRDFVMVQFAYGNWMNKPDSIKTGGFNRDFNAYVCYDFPIRKSHFSFAAGVGVGTSNIYFENQQLVRGDTSSLASQIRFIPEQQDYKKYKLTTAYIEAPFELRFYGNKENRNKGFKAAVGLRVGSLLGAHTKGRREVLGAKFIDKETTKRYMDPWRFAGTVRLGWGNFTLMGTYGLNPVFKSGQGPDVIPYSIGLCITGL